jgi:lysophospholipase L1-like esterase
MLFRRMATTLLLTTVFVTLSTGPASHATETKTTESIATTETVTETAAETTTRKHPTPKPATTSSKSVANTSGKVRRAPLAKPFKTTRGHKSKHSSKSTSSKTSSTKSSTRSASTESSPAPSALTTHASATHVAAALRPATLTSVGGSRTAITDRLLRALASTRVGIENPRALRPFFDQLHQLEADPKGTLVRVIQFGDSHTAGESFTGALRSLFQGKFGDGGAGFSFPGYPFAGYRIHGTRRAQSTGWLALGTHLSDIGDGMVGMGGVSLSTEAAGNWVSLDAEASALQVQYLIQPNGGSFEIRDNDTLIATVSTAKSDIATSAITKPATPKPAITKPAITKSAIAKSDTDPSDSLQSEPATPETIPPDPITPATVASTSIESGTAGQFGAPVEPGPHHFEILTTEDAPVRLLGLGTENSAGVTYEAAGINGAEASLFLRWNEALQQPLLAAANPALVVLSYGTNEAGDRNWTEESYAAMFHRIIERVRRVAPNASILVVGPPDRALRAGRRAWKPFAGVDRIVAAQRSVCREMRCAYWDQRSRMGGLGSMRDWVSISWAQPDHTHFTGEGYTELAGALFSDIVQQYDTYEPPITRAQGETK